MIHRRMIFSVVAVVLLGLSAKAPAGYTTLMDQIGPNGSYLVSGTGGNSQVFESNISAYNEAFVDNFSITGGTTTLNEVDAAFLGYNLFTSSSFSDVTNWQVAIYSSVSAAANSGTSLTGDVFNIITTPSQVTLTTGYGPDAYSALVQIPISVQLGPGTYYVAVIGYLNHSFGQLAVYGSKGGTPADANAVVVVPGGGFGYSGNMESTNLNAAYRILGTPAAAVPEPASAAILATGLLTAFAARARLRRRDQDGRA